MTDDLHGMEGSNNRIHKMIRTAFPAVILAGAVAVAGCGGGGGGGSATAPAPVSKTSSNATALVTPEGGTAGLLGGAGRVTATKKQFNDKQGPIPANANRKTNAQKHGVAA